MSASLVSSGLRGSPIFVVDSWPVLEWANRKEPAMTLFRQRLERADRGELRLFISRLNVGEVKYNFKIKQRRGEIGEIDVDFASQPFEVLSVDDALVDSAAELKGIYPISYADCFVAALAQRYDAPIITGDPDFRKLLSLGLVQLDWLGA